MIESKMTEQRKTVLTAKFKIGDHVSRPGFKAIGIVYETAFADVPDYHVSWGPGASSWLDESELMLVDRAVYMKPDEAALLDDSLAAVLRGEHKSFHRLPLAEMRDRLESVRSR
jgi:hypothetical protein